MDMKTSPLARLNDPGVLKTDGFINGDWVCGTKRFDVIDPSSGYKLADVADLGVVETRAAIAAAETAWLEWARKTAKERAVILRCWFDLLVANKDDLARIIVAEQGKPFAEARDEVDYGASFVDWFAEEGRRIYGEMIPTHDVHKRLSVIKQAIGVCAAITPWNFPLGMITRKVAPALAAGCSVVIKPAQQTPLTALAVAELARRAGVPAGVLNVVTASEGQSIAIGKEFCLSERVRHLSFTGSTEVGRILMQQCASTIKGLSLELGGNAPFIVFDDADVDAAVAGALVAKYRNAGQACVAANRFYVQDGVYEEFTAKLVRETSGYKVGNGFSKGVDIGPLIDLQAVSKVRMHIADAQAKGARLLIGGTGFETQYFPATVLADVTDDMLCAQEETFGHVASIIKFRDETQVVRRANATMYGLAAYLYSKDIARVQRVAEALEFGMVGINTGSISAAEVPFGGIKQSGLGREGSRYGIDEYLEIKYLCTAVG